MPAIRPARLKQNVDNLASTYEQPAIFVRELRLLLNQYSDHTHHAGQSGEPLPLIESYKTPPPVMRQIWLALIPIVKRHPDSVLPLCDALWAEPNFDLRLLAARLLGQLPSEYHELVSGRVELWASQGLDRRILDGLLQYGLESLNREVPTIILVLATSWLESSEQNSQQAGLRALLAIISAPGHEHLPAIIHLITPYLRIAPSRLRPDILSVLSALIHCSPAETAYVLHQNLSAPDNPDTAWLIRHVLGEFPEESRAGLRQALKAIAK